MIRAVLDTNVLISSLLFSGLPSRLVTAWQSVQFQPVVSRSILDENLRALAYPKFHLTIDEIRGLIEEEFLPFVETVTVKGVSIQLDRDPEMPSLSNVPLRSMCHGLSVGTLAFLISAKSNRSRLSLLRSFWAN